MTHVRLLFLAALIAAGAAGTEASAQDRRPYGGGTPGSMSQGEARERAREERQISSSEALSIARQRAGRARYVGALPPRGNSYVFRFEDDDGRIFDISVDARSGRAGGG
ncbi:PepSY domain-containing protein [Brevundimonas vitis]|uniref:PepSY domain-containing protein n=1 Tax=Brevundimonas vitisensis TaxID=2800818 RepID=A0ABX7BP62_9CAUL|nr:PepSY domain-containing protein [Brevundimonas vitisensis]QQQ18151.1 PepSY domain-containing protein [Brevundimonas vitisensis]